MRTAVQRHAAARLTAEKALEALKTTAGSNTQDSNLSRTFATFRLKPRNPWKLYPVTPRLTVPDHIVKPPYAEDSVQSTPSIRSNVIELKTKKQIEEMRTACEMASWIREFAGKQVEPGITTDEIDKRVHDECIRIGAYPSPLGYCGFPKSICTSVNSVVCHGIPDLRPLEEGDIINIDVSVYFNGYHGDCSAMFVAGKADPEAIRLINATKEAMEKAISICGPNVPLNRIGREIQNVADREGYGLVREFCGHGIGKEFHIPPHIFHYANVAPGVMLPGMVFTIEPIMNESGTSKVFTMADNWTVLTEDGSRSAQFEQTIAITEDGHEILTKHKPGQFA